MEQTKLDESGDDEIGVPFQTIWVNLKSYDEFKVNCSSWYNISSKDDYLVANEDGAMLLVITLLITLKITIQK